MDTASNSDYEESMETEDEIDSIHNGNPEKVQVLVPMGTKRGE